MNATQAAFQLEKTAPGTFILQGLLGGALGGFVALITGSVLGVGRNLISLLDPLSVTMICGGVVGMIQATSMWALYRITGLQMRAATRLIVASIAATLFVLFLDLSFEMIESDRTAWLIKALSIGIPVALLVGSRVKPLELFTFGSIAVGDSTSTYRAGSRNILATLCTFPLRFLSIGTIAFFLLLIATEAEKVRHASDLSPLIAYLVISGAYAFLSAYVTFRSPNKAALLALGFVVNIPVALIGLFLYKMHTTFSVDDTMIAVIAFCGSFVSAWLIFLVARLCVETSPVLPPSQE